MMARRRGRQPIFAGTRRRRRLSVPVVAIAVLVIVALIVLALVASRAVASVPATAIGDLAGVGLSVITIDIDPDVRIGLLTLTWHGITTAAGLVVALAVAWRYAARRALDRDHLLNLVVIAVLAGIVGARLLYLVENQPADLLKPTAWVGSEGFSFYGALILATLAGGAYARRRGLGLRHLDALATGFPLGMAVGRIGDVISGEHYGPPSDLPWAVQNAHPSADVPSTTVAYHSGGLYEIALGLAMAPIVWWVARDGGRPGLVLWSVLGLYGAGRFAMFFYRSDSEAVAAGLNGAQLVSLGLVAVAAVGTWWSMRRRGVVTPEVATR